MQHALACGSAYPWCSDGHANGWALLILLAVATGAVLVLFLVGLAVNRAGR